LEVIDLIILLPILFGAYRGFRKGLIMEVVNILAFILALLGAFKLMDQSIVWLVEIFGKPNPFIPFLAFLLVFIGIVLGVNILGKLLKGLVGLTILGSIDKLIGALIGMFKWAFGTSLVLWLLSNFSDGVFSEQTLEDSVVLPILIEFAPSVISFLSGLFPFVETMLESIQYLISD
jgi:membrane protein required for colicin V production